MARFAICVLLITLGLLLSTGFAVASLPLFDPEGRGSCITSKIDFPTNTAVPDVHGNTSGILLADDESIAFNNLIPSLEVEIADLPQSAAVARHGASADNPRAPPLPIAAVFTSSNRSPIDNDYVRDDVDIDIGIDGTYNGKDGFSRCGGRYQLLGETPPSSGFQMQPPPPMPPPPSTYPIVPSALPPLRQPPSHSQDQDQEGDGRGPARDLFLAWARWVGLQGHLLDMACRASRHVAAHLAWGASTARRSTKPAVWAVCIGLLVVLALQHSRRPKYDLDLIPGPWTHALPILGNILQVLRPDFHRVCLRWADKYGGIVRVKFLWHDGIMVTDPGALASICGRGEDAVDKAASFYTPINEMCTPYGHPNLLTSADDESWRAIRKAVALSFAFGNIRRKFPIVRERTTDLVEWLRRQGPRESVDVDQAALRVTLDVIGLTAFGHDYGCTRLEEVPYNHLLRVLPRAFTEVMRRIANPFRRLAPGLVKNGNKGFQSFIEFQNQMKQLLREIKERGPPVGGDTDIGAQLYRVLEVAQKEVDKAKKASARSLWQKAAPAITDERILSEIGILFVEGFETTGHTISWTLFNIATAPGVQQTVAEELASQGLLVRGHQECGRSGARQLELEDLKRLPYLTACVKEAMRMFPVVSIMARCTRKPTHVGPYVVPANTPVATPLFAIHNTVHNWNEPQRFNPERWMDVPLESYVLDLRAREGVPIRITPDPLSSVSSATKATSITATAATVGATSCHCVPVPAGPTGLMPTTNVATAMPGMDAKMRCSSLPKNAPATTVPEDPAIPRARSVRARTVPSMTSNDDDGDADANGELLNGGGAGRRCGISFMPFSEGPRSCVGQSLAKLEVMTVLAMILANFRIELAEEMGGREGVRQRESTHLTLQTRGTQGIRMHLYPRDQE